MKRKDIVKTIYYDYMMLKNSIDTGKIIIDSFRLELAEYYQNRMQNKAKIKEINNKIEKKKQIINKQEELLNEIENKIKTFPNQLNRTENLVFQYSIIENFSSAEVADKLNYSHEYIRKVLSGIKNKWLNYDRIFK